MNTKILSILMMLVIAAHVVSTSAVIASQKKRLQSQSASGEVPETREQVANRYMGIYHTATGLDFDTETIFSKDGFAVEDLAEEEKKLIIDSDNGISVDEFTGAIFQKVKPVLAFKAFEKMKELVPFTEAQRTCLEEGHCADQLLHKITFLAKACYDNDNTVEDLKNKITESEYTLNLGSDINSFSTNYVEEQQQTQVRSRGGPHNMHILHSEAGWIALHNVLTQLFFGGPGFSGWFKGYGKSAANYEEFFDQLREFMGIAEGSDEMGDMASQVQHMPPPMQRAFGCIGDDTDGVGCKNEMTFSTWRCALAGLNFNTPLVDMEVAEAARKVAQISVREAARIAARLEADRIAARIAAEEAARAEEEAARHED